MTGYLNLVQPLPLTELQKPGYSCSRHGSLARPGVELASTVGPQMTTRHQSLAQSSGSAKTSGGLEIAGFRTSFSVRCNSILPLVCVFTVPSFGPQPLQYSQNKL